MSKDIDHKVVLNTLGREPPETQRRNAKAKLMFKVLNKTGPKSLANLFTYKKKVTNHKLRDISTTLCLPQPRTNNMKKSLLFDGASTWNSLPTKMREGKSLSSFVRKIATHKIL